MSLRSTRRPRLPFRKGSLRAVVVLVLAASAWALVRSCETRAPGSLEDARARRLHEAWIETRGRVRRQLADDREGARHQRILLDVGGGETLLVVHNIDVADRVPVSEGDELEVRGKYVWNEKGGLVHWTHRDRSGRRDGGWIRHAGRTYR